MSKTKSTIGTEISVPYTIDDLAASSSRFGVSALMARAALSDAGKTEYTIDEAEQIIKKFISKEVE